MAKIASLPGFNCFIYAATVVWSSCARHLHTFFSFLFIILGRGPKRQRKPLCQCMRVSVFSFEPARIIITRIGNSWASLSVTANQRKKRGRRDTAASECTHKLSQFAVRPQWWRWRFWLCGLVGEHANFHHSFRPLACWFKSILIIVNDREREESVITLNCIHTHSLTHKQFIDTQIAAAYNFAMIQLRAIADDVCQKKRMRTTTTTKRTARAATKRHRPNGKTRHAAGRRRQWHSPIYRHSVCIGTIATNSTCHYYFY